MQARSQAFLELGSTPPDIRPLIHFWSVARLQTYLYAFRAGNSHMLVTFFGYVYMQRVLGPADGGRGSVEPIEPQLATGLQLYKPSILLRRLPCRKGRLFYR